MDTEFTFSSPWVFSTVAQNELISEFKSKYPQHKIAISLNRSSTNIFEFHSTEVAFNAFIGIAKDYIMRERNREIDLFEERKIHRVDGTATFSLENSRSSNRENQKSSADKLVVLENFVQEWTPSGSDGRVLFDEQRSLIGRIEALTGARIELSSNTDGLLLKSDTQESLAKAARKLKVLEKSISSKPEFHHFAITEAALSVRLRLLALKDMGTWMRETLVEPNPAALKSLRYALLVVLFKDGGVVIRTRTIRPQSGHHPWQAHPLSLLMSKDAGGVTSGPRRTAEWVKDNSTDLPVEDPFAPDQERKQNDDVERNPVNAAPKKIQTKKSRVAKGEKPEIKGSVATDAVSSSENPTTSTDQQLQCSQQKVSDAPGKQAPLHPPEIKPPFMPPNPEDAIKRPQSTTAGLEWNRHVVPQGRTGNILEIDDGNVKGVEHGKETPTKRHETMNQRKAQPKAGKTAVIGAFQKAAASILASSRICPGHLELKVCLGRLFLDHHTISSEYRNKTFEIAEWHSLFRPHNLVVPQCNFTPRITCSHMDVLSVLEIKLARGRRLFQEEPVIRKVTYVFECEVGNQERILIEIDEQKDYNVVKTRYVRGALNWFFVGRTWDARLEVASRERVSHYSHQEICSLVDSIHVSKNETEVSISITNRDKFLNICALKLLRETAYRSTVYPDLLIHLTEVQDLDVTHDPTVRGSYRGKIGAQTDMITNHRLWWEISLTSQTASTIMAENEDLELGEKAKWSPNEVASEEVIRDLHDLTNEVVTRIDHVGLGNRGPATDTSSKQPVKKSNVSIEAPTNSGFEW